jgi:NADPH:quinone reductase-like Zn-dependent oxidoreductase
MKAVLLKGYGDVDQLEYGEAPTPEPGDSEVLIRTMSSSINPIDMKLRSGMMKAFMPIQFPFILGSDVAGEIVKLGTNAKRFSVGQMVVAYAAKAQAEFVAVKEDLITPVPDGLDPSDAGAYPVVTTTGFQLIERALQPEPGQAVLVTGALGSVGRSAVHAAKQRGVRVIAGIRKQQMEAAQELGVYQVIALDEPEAVSSIPEVDAIADTVGGPVLESLLSKLKKGGKVVTIVGLSDKVKNSGVQALMFSSQADAEVLARAVKDIVAGTLVIPISQSFPFSEIREAQKTAQQGSAGKIVLVP